MKKHALVYFLYYFIYISILFFVPPFLVSKGIAQVTVGYTNSLSVILLIGSLFLNGLIADKFTSNKRVIISNLLLSAAALVGVILLKPPALLIASYVVLWVSYMTLPAMIDGLILKDIDTRWVPKIRAVGSMGAATGYFINSYIIAGVGLDKLLYANLIFIGLIIASLFTLEERHTAKAHEYGKRYGELLHDRNLRLIVIIAFLTYGVLAADDAYFYAYNTQWVKMESVTFGIIGFITIALEAALMVAFYKIAKRYNAQKVLFLCASTLALIFITRVLMVEYVAIIAVGNVAIGLFTGLFIPLILLLIEQNTRAEIKNSMLSLYFIAVKLGGALLGLLTTYIFSLTNNIPSIYLLHFAIVLLSMFFIKQLKMNTEFK